MADLHLILLHVLVAELCDVRKGIRIKKKQVEREGLVRAKEGGVEHVLAYIYIYIYATRCIIVVTMIVGS